jgi:single-strand DNA-binding protein
MKNKVILIGRVGNDPELKDVNSSKVCTMSLATTEKWKDNEGNKKEETQWHTLKIWGKAGENASKYVKKGDVFCVDGMVKYREYTDKEGVKKYFTEIVVNEMTLLPNEKKTV